MENQAGTGETLKRFVLLLFFALPLAAQTRIHVGSGAYTDSLGNVWAADSGFTGGSTFSTVASINGTPDPALFQTERYAPAVIYKFALPNGTYHANLYFAELYFTSSGKRVFNVSLQGKQVLAGLDIFAAVGQNTALIKGFDFTVSDGTFNLELDATVNNAKIDAIEILPTGPPPSPPPVVIPYGGRTFTFYDVVNANLQLPGPCSAADGSPCTFEIVLCDVNDICTPVAPGAYLAVRKSITLPVPQTQTSKVVSVQ